MANLRRMTDHAFTSRQIRRTERSTMSFPVQVAMTMTAMMVIMLVTSTPMKPVSSFVVRSSRPSKTIPSSYYMKAGRSTSSTLMMSVYSSPSRRRGSRSDDKSKRQHRVGQLVQTELARILHTGLIKSSGPSSATPQIPASLRQRISIVSVDISPDLRQARVSVSIRSNGSAGARSGITATRVVDDQEQNGVQDDEVSNENNNINDVVVDKRRAYSWLVENTKSIRHTLAQRLSHMKSSAPNLQFALVDVAAAVDVMLLIDKVSRGYQREELDTEYVHGYDDDEYYYDDEDDDEWDESFFSD